MTRAARFSAQGWEETEIECPVEANIALHVNGKAWISLQCLPQDLPDLAAGFLFNEGVIKTRAELSLLQVNPDGRLVDIWLTHSAAQPETWRISAGCGRGKSAADLEQAALPSCQPLPPAQLLAVSDDFMKRIQQGRIPGTHASALYAIDPIENLATRVDIGRHNTLDKLAGHFLLEGRSTAGLLMVTSGRISFDVMIKAARMGTPWVVSLRSATSQAVQMAEAWNISAITHARRAEFTVLTHPERLSA